MKALFKFTVFALGLAVVAFSVIAIANRFCKDYYCCCDDDFDDFDNFED